MAIYKISGTTTDPATIHIIQNNVYKGRHEVAAGNYTTQFDVASAGGVMAIAAKADGHIVGYGDITAVSGSGNTTVSGASSLGIKSIQLGNITITAGNYYVTKAITSVDTSKTMVLFNGSIGASSSPDREVFNYLTLTNSTTLRSDSLDHDTDSIARYSIIEFTSGIKSVQRGTIDMNGVVNVDATINAVDLSKAIINYTGFAVNNTNMGVAGAILSFPNNTHVRAWRSSSTGQVKVGWEVIEFE